MNFSRRQFVKGGVTAFTFGFAAPQVLCDIAFAQGVPSRNLVVVYLSGGNDSLSTVIPYRDPFYASRRPTLAIPAGNVLQIGRDSSNVELGLHPRLTGLKSIFDAGRLAIVQRTGYAEPEPIALHRLRHLGHGEHAATRRAPAGSGAISTRCTTPIDPLVAWNTQRETPRPLMARTRRRAGDHQSGHVCVLEPEHRRRGRLTSAPRRRASRRTSRSIGRTWRS